MHTAGFPGVVRVMNYNTLNEIENWRSSDM